MWSVRWAPADQTWGGGSTLTWYNGHSPTPSLGLGRSMSGLTEGSGVGRAQRAYFERAY